MGLNGAHSSRQECTEKYQGGPAGVINLIKAAAAHQDFIKVAHDEWFNCLYLMGLYGLF
jgi:hypothetical protein